MLNFGKFNNNRKKIDSENILDIIKENNFGEHRFVKFRH